MSGKFRAVCVDCGWSNEREKSASNLPVESNRNIARTVANLHEYGPRFGERADETHRVRFTEVADDGNRGGD